MILRFNAEPGQASNLKVRLYTQDRASLLLTVTSGIVEEIETGSSTYRVDIGDLAGVWFVLVNLIDTGEVTNSGFASAWSLELSDTPPQLPIPFPAPIRRR